MAGNTRGKLKEELEGMHRNFSWIIVHCAKCIELIGGQHDQLTDMFLAVGEQAKAQDDILQDVYSTI